MLFSSDSTVLDFENQPVGKIVGKNVPNLGHYGHYLELMKLQ